MKIGKLHILWDPKPNRHSTDRHLEPHPSWQSASRALVYAINEADTVSLKLRDQMHCAGQVARY